MALNALRVNERLMFVGIMRDVTERKQTEQKLLQLAQHDGLTALPNRSLFMDRLNGALMRVSRSGKAVGLMFLDIDGFKQINDTLGHHAGDELLKQFAARLAKTVRETDTVSRFGGDEFTIILEGLTQAEQNAGAVGDKIIDAMQEPFLLGEIPIKITTSIGLVIHSMGETTCDDLIRRADRAMYKAKHSGKNCIHIAGMASSSPLKSA